MMSQGCCDGLFGILLPKVAPEWYRRKIQGSTSKQMHIDAAPEGSLLLLGHISLDVADVDGARTFLTAGLGLSHATHGQDFSHSAAGPSQLRLSRGPEGHDPGLGQVWPGELWFWVEDIRPTTDMLNMLGQTLGTDLVTEYREALSGGEYSLRLKCAFATSGILATEAPNGWAPRLRAITAQENPGNALALIEARVILPRRGQVEAVARFYEQIFSAKVSRHHVVYDGRAEVGSCTVHFGPGPGLHQGLSFLAEAGTVTPSSNLASLCIYLRSTQEFRLTFLRCRNAGLLLDGHVAGARWPEAEEACEFWISGIIDPVTQTMVLPMKHIIRSASHAQCPLLQPCA